MNDLGAAHNRVVPSKVTLSRLQTSARNPGFVVNSGKTCLTAPESTQIGTEIRHTMSKAYSLIDTQTRGR